MRNGCRVAFLCTSENDAVHPFFTATIPSTLCEPCPETDPLARVWTTPSIPTLSPSCRQDVVNPTFIMRLARAEEGAFHLSSPAAKMTP